MAHFHVRAIGYVAFFVLIGLIAAGFATRRTGLATLGAVGVLLPVFAQFAGVMFFLAGLGVLNAVWLPVLDVSYELQNWGLVINAPNDALRWLLGLAGVRSIWPTTVFFIASGALVFFVGVYAWLAAHARREPVAGSWMYRLSRHPQYLGWILWTYGAYLLLEQMQYPRRSWGIGASLPWLISTMVIIGVALVEELNMRRRHGEAYETYRRSAPFLFPVPRVVSRLFSSPIRALFGTERPERTREVVAIVAFYTVLLVSVSAFFYAGGLDRTLARFASAEARDARIRELVTAVQRESAYRRRYRVMMELAAFGEPAVDSIVALLEGPEPSLRVIAAESLERSRSVRVVPPLCAALSDADENLRYRAAIALGAIGSEDARPALVPLLDDPAIHVRVQALQDLAALGDRHVLERAPEYLEHEIAHVRVGGLAALGTLGSADGVPLASPRLMDPSPWVRREAVLALLRMGSPEAWPALERALADDDWDVRVYAAEALKRL